MDLESSDSFHSCTSGDISGSDTPHLVSLPSTSAPSVPRVPSVRSVPSLPCAPSESDSDSHKSRISNLFRDSSSSSKDFSSEDSFSDRNTSSESSISVPEGFEDQFGILRNKANFKRSLLLLQLLFKLSKK